MAFFPPHFFVLKKHDYFLNKYVIYANTMLFFILLYNACNEHWVL